MDSQHEREGGHEEDPEVSSLAGDDTINQDKEGRKRSRFAGSWGSLKIALLFSHFRSQLSPVSTGTELRQQLEVAIVAQVGPRKDS